MDNRFILYLNGAFGGELFDLHTTHLFMFGKF